jgi:predicted permease
MPDWRAIVRERVAAAKLDPARESEIVDEITQHVEDRYRELAAAGVPEADAVCESLKEIDARECLVRELERLPRIAPVPPVGSPEPRTFVAGLGQDLRYTLRLLRKSPGFTFAAVVTIALSTGPTIAALGVTNWLFLRPIPGIHESGRLASVYVGQWSPDGRGISPSWVSYDDLAGHAEMDVAVSLDQTEPLIEPAVLVSANYFDVLGARTQHGRLFQPDDDSVNGGATVAILEARFARRLFGETGAAIGRPLRLNGHTFRVIGVLDDAFRGTSLTDRPAMWLPARATRRLSHAPESEWAYGPGEGPFYQLVARLAPGASVTQADAEIRVLMRSFADDGPGAKYKTTQPTLFAGVGVGLFERAPMWDLVRLILWVGAALVVLGAANLANLFLSRQARRAQEAAVRRALGASAGRIARLPMIEAVVLAIAGGALGVGFTLVVRAALEGVNIPFFGEMTVPMDWRLFAMALALSLIVGLVLSVLPARLATRADLARAIGRDGRGATRFVGRFRTGLAVTQVALSLGLLVGALLFVRTMQNLNAVDLGFDARGVTNVRLSLRPQGYLGPRAVQFHRDLLARVEADPGIEAASLSLAWPFSGFSRQAMVHLPGQEPKSSAVRVLLNEVSPGYFRTIGLAVTAGRSFTDAETFVDGPEPGLVISEAMARRCFGDAPAVGRMLVFAAGGRSRGQQLPVIGVVHDARWNSFENPELMVYRPHGANAFISSMLVRSSRSPEEVLRLVRAAVRQIDPSVPVQLGALQAAVSERMTAQRIRAWSLGALAAIGFVLAAVGIHGLVSQAVVDRTREFGIRRAVGAGTREVVVLVVRQGVRVLALGVPLGLITAALASRWVRGQLFGITPLDPWVYAAAALSLAMVVAAACIAPARRAARVNPVDVLRGE